MTHETLTARPADMTVDEAASAAAPLIFFDGIPSFGLNGGVVNLTLEAVTFTATNGDVTPKRRTVAHVRTSLAGLGHLKAALDGMDLLARPAHGGAKVS